MFERAQELTRAGNSGRPPKVLLVDDEPQVLLALQDVLESDFEVTATDKPEEALEMAAGDPQIAVVLSDQRMPKMTGDELLAKLRDRSSAACILCTGYADLHAVVRAVNEGRIFAYVTKPWDSADLRHKIRHAAEHFRLNHELAREKQLLSDLMTSIPDAIFFKDADQRYVRVNQAFLDTFGVTDEAAVLGKRITELLPGQRSALEIEATERLILQDGQPRRDVQHYRQPGHKSCSSATTRAAVRSPEGQLIGIVGVSQDITETVRTQEALRVSEERLRLAFLAANTGLFDWNLQTGETLYSPTSEALSNVGETAVDDFAALEARVHPDDRDRLRAAVNDHLDRRTPLRGFELRATNRQNEMRWFEISAQAAWNEQGMAVRLVGATADITERKAHASRLARFDYLSTHDELTGLPNRTLLSSELARLLSARAPEQKLALVCVDVTRFRHINETLGRSGGDELLREVAGRVTAAAKAGDLVARFDGNSFMIVMSEIDDEANSAHWVEQQLLPAVQQTVALRGIELSLSVKVGLALFPSDGVSEDTLIANAEAALKQAKQSALPYLFYAPSMNSRVAEKLRLETKLRRALPNDEFLLYYQPKIDLKSGVMVGMEALIRWRDPETGLIPPGVFIPVLEETQLILQVGRWVIERAARQISEWLEAGIEVPRVAVNVSALQLAQRDFVGSIDEVLRRYPSAGELLDLELTESVLMDDLSGNIEKLRAVKERGLQVAIDDFGTGYSSLGYLSRLPLDALKVDRSFIDQMADDPQQMSIVTAIISLAHSIDLKVIAEGVETPTQAQLLRLLRCDQIQGYLMARPQPATDVAALVTRRFEVPKAGQS
jgi:diguanylate cyclase (GGDEF)-like protein/PAS domain S-box-containing protein